MVSLDPLVVCENMKYFYIKMALSKHPPQQPARGYSNPQRGIPGPNAYNIQSSFINKHDFNTGVSRVFRLPVAVQLNGPKYKTPAPNQYDVCICMIYASCFQRLCCVSCSSLHCFFSFFRLTAAVERDFVQWLEHQLSSQKLPGIHCAQTKMCHHHVITSCSLHCLSIVMYNSILQCLIFYISVVIFNVTLFKATMR